MTFKGPGGFGRIVNIIMNIFMCAAMSFFMLWIAQQRAGGMAQILTPTAFIMSFITAFGIGFTTADLIPVFKAGDSVAKKLGLKGVPAYLVTVLVIDLIVTTIIGLLMTLINMTERVGLAGAFMAWLSTYPITLLICYVIQLIVMKPAMAFAKRVSGFDPENPLPPAGMMPPMGAPGGQGMPPAGAPGGPGAAGMPPTSMPSGPDTSQKNA